MFVGIRFVMLLLLSIGLSAVASFTTYKVMNDRIVALQARLEECATKYEQCNLSVNMLSQQANELKQMLDEANNLCSKRVSLYKNLASRVANAKTSKKANNKSNCNGDLCGMLNSLFK